MKALAALLTALSLAACGGSSAHGPDLESGISWNERDGLVATLGESFPEDSEITVVQLTQYPLAKEIPDWVLVDDVVTSADLVVRPGAATGIVLTFVSESQLQAGTVINHRIERVDPPGLIEPNQAWLSVDGVELASYSLDP